MNRLVLFLILQVLLVVLGVIGIGGILVLGLPHTLSDEQAIVVGQSLLHYYVIGVIIFDVLYWAATVSSGWRSRFLTCVFLAYSCAALLTLVYSTRTYYTQGIGRSIVLVLSGALLITTLWLSFKAVRITIRARSDDSAGSSQNRGPTDPDRDEGPDKDD